MSDPERLLSGSNKPVLLAFQLTHTGFPLPSQSPTNLNVCQNASLQTFNTEEFSDEEKVLQIKNKTDLQDGKASGQHST